MSSFFRSLACCSNLPEQPSTTTSRRDITISLPTKGLDLYSYIASDTRTNSYTIKFEVPAKHLVSTKADNFSVKQLEIVPNCPRSFTSRFQWTALCNNVEVASGWNDINALTGGLESGTMLDTKHITPVVLPDVIIVYGFYDAGSGEFGLPSRHQCYVTITPLQNHWMGSLAPQGTPMAEKPFSRFVLAAAHDPGMHDFQTMNAVMTVASVKALKLLRKSLSELKAFEPLPDKAVVPMLPNIIYGLAYTQKKTIENMLMLGCRYFEWRPAKLLPIFKTLSGLPDNYYFTHGSIPGMPTDDFLEDIVAFLDRNPTEVVVVHFRNDGIPKECTQPTPVEVVSLIDQACAGSKTGLKWGDVDLVDRAISKLRWSQTRLICTNMVAKYDSYDGKAYATLKPDPVIARFNSMNTASQNGSFTVLQCQATATSIPPVVVYSVLSADAATSVLTATKALMDQATLPWIRDNALSRLQAETNIVVMNDFIDGATVDTAISMSKERLAG